ncbi:hypothetical protein SDC9_198230 [bioreactor metagenome]|uniref:Uncharacterized protein n=1 Tax=bioreactor metagenome TaxID=1076179 RepID=A0A645IJE4_9ZZZZ
MIQRSAEGTKPAIRCTAEPVTQASSKRRRIVACIKAKGKLDLRGAQQGGHHPIDRPPEYSRTECNVGGEGECIGQTGLLIIGCSKFVQVI